MENAKKLNKIKIIIVVAFIILFATYSYMSYRADYLQILEIIFNTQSWLKITKTDTKIIGK